MFQCADGGCIKQSEVCTGQPLCRDASDMAPDLCQGSCYIEYPERRDPFLRMCMVFNSTLLFLSNFVGWREVLLRNQSV